VTAGRLTMDVELRHLRGNGAVEVETELSLFTEG
jgi:hypothetical protein